MVFRFLPHFLFCGSFCASFALAENTQIPARGDGDQYLYIQSNNVTRSYMNVGQYYGGRSTHYYVGLVNWNDADLSPLAGKTNVTLSLYVQNFVDPVFTGGNTNSQPAGFTYPTSGNFTIKVVALPGIPAPALMTDGWVKTNMINVAGVASVTLTNAGYNTVNLGNTVANWIAAGNGPRWLGFVGTASTTSLYTSVQLGTLEANYSLDGTLLTEAAPMYLSAPTPAPVAKSSRILAGGQLEMVFETVPNRSYVLKTKSNLNDPSWETVQTVTANSSSITFTVPMTNAPGRGFFRLEVTNP